MSVTTEVNFYQSEKRFFRPYHAGDDFYQALIDAHRDLSDEQSALLNARLILLLSNHIGDLDVLRDAMQKARKGVVDNNQNTDQNTDTAEHDPAGGAAEESS